MKKEYSMIFWGFALLVVPSLSIKMTLSIPGLQKQCFYESLGTVGFTQANPKNIPWKRFPGTSLNTSSRYLR